MIPVTFVSHIIFAHLPTKNGNVSRFLDAVEYWSACTKEEGSWVKEVKVEVGFFFQDCRLNGRRVDCWSSCIHFILFIKHILDNHINICFEIYNLFNHIVSSYLTKFIYEIYILFFCSFLYWLFLAWKDTGLVSLF